MKTFDALNWVKTSVLSQRSRNFLTVLGFAIGVSAVTLLAAMGDSLKQFVLNEFTQFGSNIIGITPGKTDTMGVTGILRTNRGISLEDAQSLATLPEVEGVVPVVAGTAEIKYRNLTRATELVGVSHYAAQAWKMTVAQGQFLPADDLMHPRAFVVLGSKLHRELFGTAPALGEPLRIAGSRFTVVGVFAPKGQFLGMDLDEMAYIPAARGLSMFNRESLMEVDLLYSPGLNSDWVAEQARQHLLRRHGVEDFTIVTQDQMLDTLDGILNVVRFAGIAIGSISLLVGSVGIYSILTISLWQRRNEVGLLRALGMQQNLLVRLFLGEAVFIAVLGGAAGLVILTVVQMVLSLVLPQLPPLLTLSSAGLGLGVSVVIGILAGARPAIQASRLPPIEALRAE
ncbi:ABC transporter permease [Aestuariibacter halophilus]|uniref:ABC transporter permease n=1 Tax=Fluctibacter halophilus TaxID=226011 RepID=A0ABS8GAA9_9ALTE|nr:ABC transporter permease [Aestuariibacter halophilus]MCC2616740.1 ABC transporter permease [Aestuariibacter halophilus]